MNGVDLFLLAAACLFAVLGWRMGLVRGVCSLLGVSVGAGAGWLAGRVIGSAADLPPVQRALVMVLVMGVVSGLVQALLTRIVQPLHDGLEASRAAGLNRGAGALLTSSILVALVWATATALALLPSSPIGALMRGSVVLVGMDRVAPADAGMLFGAFRSGSADLRPRVFTGLGLVPPPEVPAPDPVPAAVLRTAERSVVRVWGENGCGMLISGSGTVVAPDLVLTGAHVVAGVASPVVTALGGATSARSVVVRFDPALDVAVLRVAGLPVPPAPTGPDPDPAQSVALVGYPEGGAQRVLPARVRGTVEATGEDLYGRAGVHRPVVVLAAGVEPGDSGGPVLGADGRILGLVFAATIDRVGQTGYALPLSAVAPLLPGAAQAPALVTADLPSDCPGERR